MFIEWAKRWNIPEAAISDLQASLLALTDVSKPGDARSETRVVADVREEAAQKGGRLWRNNVGAVTTDDGRHIRFGLANDSKAMNKKIKSHDLIGGMPKKILPEHVGQTWLLFTSRECKRPGWKFTGTERENAQLKWAVLILTLGGDACFTTGKGTL